MASEQTIHEKLHGLKGDANFISDNYEYISNIGSGKSGPISKIRVKKFAMAGSALKGQNIFQLGGRWFKSKKSDKVDSIYYALKTIDINRVTSEDQLGSLKTDLEELNTLDHPNIVRFQEIYIIKSKLYLVMDYCDGGTLYDRYPRTEQQVAKITEQVLSALKYMHDKGMVHHDIKLENIVYATSTDDLIQLVDFGVSVKYFSGDEIYSRVEYMYYAAPEVIQGQPYTSKSDLWSLGVMIYMLFSYRKPFFHKNKKELRKLILEGQYKPMNTDIWNRIADDAKDIIRSLLQVNPAERLDASTALNHDWIQRCAATKSSENLSESKQQRVANVLHDYSQTSALKKVALNLIAHNSSLDDILKLRQIFEVYDTTNDGVISLDELKDGLKKSNFSEEDIEKMFESIDVNKSGKIMYTEFLAATILVRENIDEARIAAAFDKIDNDNTGFISRENLRQALSSDGNADEKLINEIINEADSSKDGQISYKEFLKAFRRNCSDIAHELSSSRHD